MKNLHGKKNYFIYQILGIVLLCVSLIALTYSFTTSWFRDSSTTSNGEPNVSIIGTIGLDVTTNFNFYNLALAPDTTYTLDKDNKDIGTYVKTSEDHNIDGAFVRIKFETNRSEVTLYFNGNTTSSSTYSSSDKNKWVYNSSDGYYYYLGSVKETNIQFNAGYSVDNTLNNEKANATVVFSFKVEAIQRQYGAYKAVWTTAPEIFNSFALSETGR